MKKIVAFILALVLLLCTANAIASAGNETAQQIWNDSTDRFGENLFQWPQTAWCELGQALRALPGIFQDDNFDFRALACQLYSEPTDTENIIKREAAVAYASSLLQQYLKLEAAESTAVFILDNMDEEARGRWIVSFQTAQGIYTFEIGQSQEFYALHHYDENDRWCMPFISGNTFARFDLLPLFWRADFAPASFWNTVEPYIMTCRDMDAMIATWNNRWGNTQYPFVNQAVSYLWTIARHPGDDAPMLYGIPGDEDFSAEEIIQAATDQLFELSGEQITDAMTHISFWYNRLGKGSSSWIVAWVNPENPGEVLAYVELDADGKGFNWSVGSGKG